MFLGDNVQMGNSNGNQGVSGLAGSGEAPENVTGWNSVLQQLVTSGFDTTRQIFTAQYGGPQPGQYFQNGQNVNYALPSGSVSAFGGGFPSSTSMTSSSLTSLLPWLLIAGVAVVALKK